MVKAKPKKKRTKLLLSEMNLEISSEMTKMILKHSKSKYSLMYNLLTGEKK